MSKTKTVVNRSIPWFFLTFFVLATLKFGGVLPLLPLWLVFLPLIPVAIWLAFVGVVLAGCAALALFIFVAAACGWVDEKDFK